MWAVLVAGTFRMPSSSSWCNEVQVASGIATTTRHFKSTRCCWWLQFYNMAMTYTRVPVCSINFNAPCGTKNKSISYWIFVCAYAR
jgi:hypothetical protein